MFVFEFLIGCVGALFMLGVPVYCVVRTAKYIDSLRLRLKSQSKSKLLYIKFIDLSIAVPALLVITTKLQLLNDSLNAVLLGVTIIYVVFKIIKTFGEIRSRR